MDPKHLIQLAIIAELGSVTKAARKLNITQPTLSRTIKLIESRVGGAVLRRGRYGVTPTDIGQRLAEEGRQVMRRSQRADSAIHEWKHGLSGQLRIGVGPMLAATIMGDFFTNLVHEPANYNVSIFCEYAARLVDRLNNDQLDVAVIPFDLNRNEDNLHREELFKDNLAVFVSSEDPLAKKVAVAPEELMHHEWISVGEISGLFDTTRDTFHLLNLPYTPPRIENTGDVTMTFRMLERSRSCSILPFGILGSFQDRFKIAPVDLNVQLGTRNVALWTTFQSRDRPEVVEFTSRLSLYLEAIGLT